MSPRSAVSYLTGEGAAREAINSRHQTPAADSEGKAALPARASARVDADAGKQQQQTLIYILRDTEERLLICKVRT